MAITPDKSRVVFGGSDRWVYSLAVEDGMIVWKTEFGYSVQSPPVVRSDGSIVVTGTLPKEVKTEGKRSVELSTNVVNSTDQRPFGALANLAPRHHDAEMLRCQPPPRRITT